MKYIKKFEEQRYLFVGDKVIFEGRIYKILQFIHGKLYLEDILNNKNITVSREYVTLSEPEDVVLYLAQKEGEKYNL